MLQTPLILKLRTLESSDSCLCTIYYLVPLPRSLSRAAILCFSFYFLLCSFESFLTSFI